MKGPCGVLVIFYIWTGVVVMEAHLYENGDQAVSSTGAHFTYFTVCMLHIDLKERKETRTLFGGGAVITAIAMYWIIYWT